MIRMTRRRRSKETAKNSYSLQLDEDHTRGAQRRVDDEVGDVVGGVEEATVEKTTG